MSRIRLILASAVAALALSACASSAQRQRAAPSAASPQAGHLACPSRVRLAVGLPRPVGRGAGPLALDGSSVWVARPQAGTVTRVTGTGLSVLRPGGWPISLVSGFGKVWVALRDADRVAGFSTRTLAPARGASLPVPVSVVAGAGQVWALSLDNEAVYPIDPASGAERNPIYSPVAAPSQMILSDDELWVLGGHNGGFSPIDIRLGRIVRTGFDVPGRPLSGLSGQGRVLWLSEPRRRDLLRVDAATAAVQELPAPYGLPVAATAVGGCGLWVASSSGTLALSSQTGAPLSPPIHVGRSVAALASSGDGVWASDPVDGTVVYVGIR